MKFEKGFYWLIWILAIIHALWKFMQSSKNEYLRSPYDYEKGFLGRMKDSTDLEWQSLTAVFKDYWMLLLIEVVLSRVISRINKMVVPFYYASYSILCLVAILGVRGTLAFCITIFFMYVIHTFGYKTLVYLFCLCTFLVFDGELYQRLRESLLLNATQSFLFDVGMAWLMAKSLSFAVDRIHYGVHRRITLLEIANIFAYCLYLPAVFTGPIICYETFYSEIKKPAEPVLCKSFLFSILHFFYLMLLYFVYEFLLHFIFSSAIQFYPNIVNAFDHWSLFGLGYALPMMFHFKYFIIFSIAGNIAKMENITLPPPPKCISCIHLSSFLFRHFDRGLYLWILRYLYRPLINEKWTSLRKMYALAICFVFTCLWHGMGKSICAWSMLNFLLITSEIFIEFLSSSSMLGKFYKEKSAVTKERLSAAIATPHFIFMCISSVFFLANWDIGMLLIRRILLGGIFPGIPLAVVMYCGCHVSMDSKRYQKIN